MFTLPSRRDSFKVIIPDEFLLPEIVEKYSPIIQRARGYVCRPIDFINETIQKVQVFGFSNAAFEQNQPTGGRPLRRMDRLEENNRLTGGAVFNYRNVVSPIALTDKTLNIEFRHTLGYLNYLMMMENFIYLYCKDTPSNRLLTHINIDLFNQKGEIYAQLVLMDPVINSMDMLDFDYTQPIAQSGTFKVEFKYSNFDYVFITEEDSINSIATVN